MSWAPLDTWWAYPGAFVLLGLVVALARFADTELHRLGTFGLVLALLHLGVSVLTADAEPLAAPLLVGVGASLLWPVSRQRMDRWHAVALGVSGLLAHVFGPGHDLLPGLPPLQAPTDLQAVLVHLGVAVWVFLLLSEKAPVSTSRHSLSGIASSAATIPVRTTAAAAAVRSASVPTDQSLGASTDTLQTLRAITSGVGRLEDLSSTEGDPNASQIMPRTLLLDDEEQDRIQLQALLEPVVVLLKTNFRPRAALAFLRDPRTGHFRLNARWSSGPLREDAVVIPDQGLLGSVLDRPTGFATGDIGSYGRPLEYLPEGVRVHSLLAIGARNLHTNEITALLVVDSDQPRAFGDRHVEWMRRFQHIASALVSLQHVRSLLARQAKTTDVLYDIQSRLNRHLKLEDVLTVLQETLKDIFPYRRLVVLSWSSTTRSGKIAHIGGEPLGLEVGKPFQMWHPSSAYGRVFIQRRPELFFASAGQVLLDPQADSSSTWIPRQAMAVPLLNDDGKSIAVLALETDEAALFGQTDLKLLSALASSASNALSRAQMYAAMERLATMDGLTQVPNHRHFQTLLSRQIEMITRYGGHASLLLFDIDHFKTFNDTYGHPVGDEVLRQVARCVRGAIRTTDVLARYGGEEFVVLLPNTDSEAGLLMAERTRQAIEAMVVPHDSGPLRVTVSIGVCCFPDLAQSRQELIDNADKAMYLSKRSGRNRASLWSPKVEDELARLASPTRGER